MIEGKKALFVWGRSRKKSPPLVKDGDTLLTKNIQNQLNQIFAIRLTDVASKHVQAEKLIDPQPALSDSNQRTRYIYP